MKNYLLFICLFGAIQLGIAQVSGTVFRDLPVNGTTLNTYGVKDANEMGVEGVTVTVYPGGANTLTAADGTWSLAGTGALRVEFSWTETWLKSSPVNSGSNTSVQFVNGGDTNVDFGLYNPAEFVDTGNPTVITTMYIAGDPLAGGAAGTQNSFVGMNYYSMGQAKGDHVWAAQSSEIGSLWGIGYDKQNKRAFSSAVARRHCGFGAQGPAGIYVLDYSNPNSPSVTTQWDLSGLLPTTASPARGLPSGAGDASHDTDMFNLVGRMSFGDLEVSDDGKTLWVVNLTDRALYEIDISNYPATPTSAIKHDTGLDPGCSNGDFIPWAIGILGEDVYVGVVCTGETSSNRTDLTANIMKLTPTGFTSVFSFPLDYTRGVTCCNSASSGGTQGQWNTWIDQWSDYGNSRPGYPQPILADIVWDIDGSLIMGFMDRTGMQTGLYQWQPDPGDNTTYEADAGGDILRAYGNTTTGWVLENNASSGGNITAGAGNGQGPGGGEFYYDDKFDPYHAENTLGGLTTLAGSGNVLVVNYDPFTTYSGGITRMDNTTGGEQGRYEIYVQSNPGTQGKSVGLGDLESLTAPAPIEIGNLVWDDANSNGIQDAGESGISGVIVELQDAGGTQITTATTDANGNYIFSSDPNGTSTASHIYNVALSANTAYKLVVPTTNGGNNLTTANTGEGSNTDINDSDANTGTGVADVQATDIPIIGANNHSFDFAYAPVPVGCSMAVTSVTPTACNAATNTYDLAVVVTYSTPPAGNITVTTDNGGSMSVAQMSSPQTITLTGLTSDGVAGIDVTAVFDNDGTCTDTSVDAYDAPTSCAVGCPPTVCGTVTVVKN